MFNFVVKRLGFLKAVPFAPLIFDVWLRIWQVITASEILDFIEAIEMHATRWPGVNVSLHIYGGLQFNYGDKEIGHIHSNGLLDIRFNRIIKAQLLAEGRITDHHVFNNSGWISFYIKTAADRQYAIELLNISYQIILNKKIAA